MTEEAALRTDFLVEQALYNSRNWRLKLASDDSKKRIELTTIIALLVGLVGIFGAAYLSESMSTVSGSLLSAFVSGLTTLSVALMGLGIFGILLDSKNWREYFAERLKEIVIDNAYLKTLDSSTLKQLQTSVLKAQFNNQQIDKDGSFLEYFHIHLHKFISEPYREDVSAEVLMKKLEGSDDFLVIDKVRYVCRASGGKIQNSIGWKPDLNEFKEVRSLKIKIQFPANHEKAGETQDIEVDQTKINEGVKESLSQFESVDGLVVITEAEYVVEWGKFQYWQMAHPTKNFHVTITYPKDLNIQFKTLVLEDVVSQITEHDGYLNFSYGTWALPQSGLAWLIKSA